MISQSTVYGVHSTDCTATAAISTLLDALPRSRIRRGQARLRLSRHKLLLFVISVLLRWHTPLLYSNSVSRIFWRATRRYFILRYISPPLPTSQRHNDELTQSGNVSSYLLCVSPNFLFFLVKFFCRITCSALKNSPHSLFLYYNSRFNSLLLPRDAYMAC